jgi:hypothetical protein
MRCGIRVHIYRDVERAHPRGPAIGPLLPGAIADASKDDTPPLQHVFPPIS